MRSLNFVMLTVEDCLIDVVCQIKLEDQGSCKELFVGIASPLKTAKDYRTLLLVCATEPSFSIIYLAAAKSLMIESLAMTVLPAVTSTEDLTGFEHVGHIKVPSL